MRTTKDGRLLLDGRPESKDISNHPRSIEERGKAEERAIDDLRGRSDLMLVRNMKPNLLIFLSRSHLSLSHWKNSFQETSLGRLQLTWSRALNSMTMMLRKMNK